MRDKDAVTKEYMKDAEIFADAFNFLLYNGEQIIKPEHLHEIDVTSIVMPYGDNAGSEIIQKYRDILKTASAMAGENTAYLILGSENQSEIHYAMPVRNMLYDAAQYTKQIESTAKFHKKAKTKKTSKGEFLSGFYKSDKLIPVITLVIYFGPDEWDAPRSIHDMLNITDEKLLSFVPDYRINLIAPNEIKDEDFSKFHTDLSTALRYIKHSKNKKKMREMVYRDNDFEHVPNRTVNLINTITNSHIKINKEKGETNMRSIWDELISEEADLRAKELVVPMAEKMAKQMAKQMAGQMAGQMAEQKAAAAVYNTNIDNIKRMLNKKFLSYEEIAECLDVPVELVENIANGKTA